jgi:transcriptional regulator with XRE-family HTH domain
MVKYYFDADELRRLMAAAGFSTLDTSALADEVGLTDTAIRNYLSGKRMPSGDNLAKLTRALGCDVWDLLRADEVAVP